MWIEFCVLLSIFGYLLYRWATYNYDYFEKRGIPHDKPVPMFGSVAGMIFRQRTLFDIIKGLYAKHNGKYYGMFDQRQPVLLIRDPDLLKKITVKDFDHFMNHRTTFSNDGNLFSNSIFFLKDAKWKDMRSTLSPAFTGSKMRQMFELINQVAQHAVTYLNTYTNMDPNGTEIEMKKFCTRFSSDVIASTAFGLQVNSFKDENNEFYQMGKRVTYFSPLQNIKFFIFQNIQFLVKVLRLNLLDKESTDYFMHLVIDAMKYRKEHDIFRPDMINLLMEARGMVKTDQAKSYNREWSDIDIVAQCFLFFFAGFDTTAVLMCTAAHELMENPDIQEKLYDEIDNVMQDLDGKSLTYEALHGMKYMDMVVSETLRKWPPAVVMDRQCNKDVSYDLDNGERLEFKKGDIVWIPPVGFHYDPLHFEEPTKFDPERFSDENKDTIKPFTYLPFGLGPRNCIGSRFALLESKAILFYLLNSYKIVPAEKSTIPLELSPSSFQITPKNGFWMKLIPRKKE